MRETRKGAIQVPRKLPERMAAPEHIPRNSFGSQKTESNEGEWIVVLFIAIALCGIAWQLI